MDIPIFEYKPYNIGEWFGSTSPYLIVHYDTVLYTWLAMGLLFLGIYAFNKYAKQGSIPHVAVTYAIESFADICTESVGYFRPDYFSFVATLFTFTFSCCVVSLLPFIEEAPKDANTTFALSVASFIYVLYQKTRQEGAFAFIKELCHPVFFMLPLNLIGELSKIISMSFRLFGNVLGGSVVFFVLIHVVSQHKIFFMVYTLSVGALWFLSNKIMRISQESLISKVINVNAQIIFVLAWLQMFFGVFESLIQSFVVAMLTITYLALSVEHDFDTDERGIAWEK